MLKKTITVILLVLFLSSLFFGIGCLLLPKYTNAKYEDYVKEQYNSFQETIKQVKSGSASAFNFSSLYKAMFTYNNALLNNQVLTSKSYEVFDVKKYGCKSKIVGYIKIPRLDLIMPIEVGTDDSVLNRGAGIINGASLPIVSENTNIVLAAHRGWGGRQMLRHIERLVPGDVIYIDNIFGEHIVFDVVNFTIIPKGCTDGLYVEQGKNLLTLYTCHPYRVNTQRYIVTAERRTVNAT